MTDRTSKVKKSAVKVVKQVSRDDKLREHLRTAANSGHKAYKRVHSNGGPVHSLISDKTTQTEIRSAAQALRKAGDRIHKEQRRRKQKIVLVASAAIGVITLGVFKKNAKKDTPEL